MKRVLKRIQLKVVPGYDNLKESLTLYSSMATRPASGLFNSQRPPQKRLVHPVKF